jgi:starch synthase
VPGLQSRFFASSARNFSGNLQGMKILLAGSELSPLVRTGGLGDALEGLPSALARRGHDVSVVLPCYRGLREDPRLAARSTGVHLGIQAGRKRLEAEVLVGESPSGVQVFLVRRDEAFDRSGIYGADGRDYEDNAERFIFFSKAVVELARRVTPPLDIVHVHDWQTALVPALLREWGIPLKSVFTVHNLAYQGNFLGWDFELTNLPGHYFNEHGLEFYGRLNLLKGGLVFADQVTTVSDRYSREIRTPEYGCGLDSVLVKNAGKLTGILNGADHLGWDPTLEGDLAATFSSTDLTGKRACRDALLKEMGLKEAPNGPVFAMTTRLAEQKGIDLLLPILDRLLSDDVRLIVLGEGDSAYERELSVAGKRHAQRFRYLRSANPKFAHQVLAGADISLIPSHADPSGLTAMYSLRNGTVPVARATGGLHQVLADYDASTATGTGFLFFDYHPEALFDAILRAKQIYSVPGQWTQMISRAMASDFSWDRAAREYEAVYAKALDQSA